MSLPHDLLEQARHLANRERNKPRQASLRRSISTAYYALFHFILDEGARQIVANRDLRKLVQRAFVHGEMKKAAKSLSSGGKLPDHVLAVYSGKVPKELQIVAKAIYELQVRRHDADYNMVSTFTRAEANALVDQAENAFAAWRTAKADTAQKDAVELFLVAMLFWERWDK